MIVPSRIKQKYNNLSTALESLAERVDSIVRAYCGNKGFPYVGRCKTVDSTAEKIESGRFEKWSDIDDLFACTVVIPTLRHEEGVIDYFRSKFDLVQLKCRGATKKPPDVFRFDATRLIATLSSPPSLESDELLYQLRFEIQIRSAFEHAWSAATHDLIYKANSVTWKQQRMAAQLKAAVEQLDALVVAFDESSRPIVEHEWPETQKKIAIADRFRTMVDNGEIPSEGEPKDWSRFADNIYSLIKSGHDRHAGSFDAHFDKCLDLIAVEIRRFTKKTFPRSISLGQLMLGILCESDALKIPLYRFSPLITDELRELYPTTSRIDEAFDIDG